MIWVMIINLLGYKTVSFVNEILYYTIFLKGNMQIDTDETRDEEHSYRVNIGASHTNYKYELIHSDMYIFLMLFLSNLKQSWWLVGTPWRGVVLHRGSCIITVGMRRMTQGPV